MTTFFSQFGYRFRLTPAQLDSKACLFLGSSFDWPIFLGGRGCPQHFLRDVPAAKFSTDRSGPSAHFRHCPAAGTALSGRIQGAELGGKTREGRGLQCWSHFFRDPFFFNLVNQTFDIWSWCFFLLKLLKLWRCLAYYLIETPGRYNLTSSWLYC